MSTSDTLIITLGGVVGGFVNMVAAGGALLSFIALLYAGVPPLTANATNLLAMPLSFVGALRKWHPDPDDWPLIGSACIGTICGALLVSTGQPSGFQVVAPWLVLAAAVLLIMQPQAKPDADLYLPGGGWVLAESRGQPAVATLLLCGAGVYAGFFGAGQGTLVLTVLALTTTLPHQTANSTKNVICLATAMFGAATFATTDLFDPAAAIWLGIGMTVGGLLGKLVQNRILPSTSRALIFTTAVGGTGWMVLTVA